MKAGRFGDAERSMAATLLLCATTGRGAAGAAGAERAASARIHRAKGALDAKRAGRPVRGRRLRGAWHGGKTALQVFRFRHGLTPPGRWVSARDAMGDVKRWHGWGEWMTRSTPIAERHYKRSSERALGSRREAAVINEAGQRPALPVLRATSAQTAPPDRRSRPSLRTRPSR